MAAKATMRALLSMSMPSGERDEGAGPRARHGLERHVEVGRGAHLDGLQLEPERLRRGLGLLQGARMGGVRRIQEDSHQEGLWGNLFEELEPCAAQLRGEHR